MNTRQGETKEGKPSQGKPGRPRRSGEVANIMVTVRLTPQEAVALDALCAALGSGISRAQALRLCMTAVKESMAPASSQT